MQSTLSLVIGDTTEMLKILTGKYDATLSFIKDYIHNDLSSFGMELPEARKAAENRSFWQMLMKHTAMQLQWCTLILD